MVWCSLGHGKCFVFPNNWEYHLWPSCTSLKVPSLYWNVAYTVQDCACMVLLPCNQRLPAGLCHECLCCLYWFHVMGRGVGMRELGLLVSLQLCLLASNGISILLLPHCSAASSPVFSCNWLLRQEFFLGPFGPPGPWVWATQHLYCYHITWVQWMLGE